MSVKVLWALTPLILAGCLSAPPTAPVNWTIAYVPRKDASAPLKAAETARLSSVEVRAPYNGTHLAVLRADGSVAFDPCNAYAAPPTALLRGAIQDALENAGLFDRIVGPSSFAASQATIEVQVTELALDCRTEGKRDASVALAVTVLKDRKVVATLKGAAKVPAGGNYSEAFSEAVSQALAAAAGGLGRFDEKK